MNICKLTVAASIITFLAAFGLIESLASAEYKIKYVGSSTVGRFMKDAAVTYSHAEFEINTKPESGGGESAVAAGKADLGGVAREVKSEILGKGVKQHLIGKDAIGVWINANNPVADLSIKQLKDIFIGVTVNWKDLGGPDLPITVYVVKPQSATRKVFRDIVLGGAAYAGKGSQGFSDKRVRTVRPDSAVLDKVARDKGGIGQLSFALGNGHSMSNRVKKVNVDGQAASVNNPKYPITRPLYLITNGEPKPATKGFIDWTVSPDGQAVIKRYFIGID